MTSTAQTPRLRADAQRNRARIIAGAAALIGERGPDVPMEEIARRAGVGVGTLYRRFPDRHSLVREVAADMFRSTGRIAAEVLDEAASGWEALVCLMRHCAEPELGALSAALRGWLAEHRDKDEELRALTAAWLARFEEAVRRAQAEGAMRTDIDGVELLRLISLITCHMSELSTEANREASVRYVEVLIDGLRLREG
ncbi:TetR/AcrR family transcriptional regulator [Glycomyces arizonensis]|uniref:TetR/AcrR family transcriptional regulator n=1 Tax=Glycomyces arizonensis TaxID=256035 RepID=UPI0004273144|nr:TetR/AcrR family transcriptional regulator [Glycomyces arizonensis]